MARYNGRRALQVVRFGSIVKVGGNVVNEFDADQKVNNNSNGSQTIEAVNTATPIYLQGDNPNEVDLGFKDKFGATIGFLVVDKNRELFFDDESFYRSLFISSNIKSSRVYNNYTRKIFKGSVGFLPDIGSSGTATFTFDGISGHNPSGTPTSQTVVSHRLTAWFCTKAGKTGANGDSNYYKIVILTMPASLLDLDAIGAKTYMIPKNNVVTLTVTDISSAKSIGYIADETWKNTSDGE